MGQSSSDTRTLADEIWNRDIKDMFTSAKMTEPFPFSAKYCFFMKFSQIYKDITNYYCFISEDGSVNCLSPILPDILSSKKLEKCSNVSFATTINDESKVLVCSKECVSIVTLLENEIVQKMVNIENSVFAFPISSNSFGVVAESKLFKVIVNESSEFEINECFSFRENFVPTNSSILDCGADHIIVLSSDSDTYFGLLTSLSQFVRNEQIAGISKIVNCGTDLYFTTAANPHILSHIAFTSLSESISTEEVALSGNKEKIPILDIEIISEKNVAVLYENSLFCTGSGKADKFNNQFVGKKLFLLSRKLFFLVIGDLGKIKLYKHPEIAQQQDAKEVLKSVDLSDLHKSEIDIVCAADEASFITFDQNKTIILWENLPNWWNAPTFLDMFGQKKAQDAQMSSDDE